MYIVIELCSSNPSACMNEDGQTLHWSSHHAAYMWGADNCQCYEVVEVPPFAQSFIDFGETDE